MKKVENQLSSLLTGESCVVSDLSAKGHLRRRLLDLGVCRGAHIECIGKSPFGDPTLFLIRGKMIAIRGSDAEFVVITKERR